MATPIPNYHQLLASIGRSYVGFPVSDWDVWSVFDANLPVLWKDAAGSWSLSWPPLASLAACTAGQRWLNTLFAFEQPAIGKDPLAFHRAIIISRPIATDDGAVDYRIVVFTTGDDLAVQFGRHNAERLNAEIHPTDGSSCWAMCFSLLGIEATAGRTLVRFHSNVDQHGERSELRRKVSELLLLSNPTWGYNYEILRHRAKFRCGELVIVDKGSSDTPVPALVLGDVAVAGLQGPVGAQLLTLRLFQCLPSDEESNCFAPTDYELDGIPLSVGLPFIWPVPIQAVRKWPGGAVFLDDDDMDTIRAIWRDYLALA